MENVMVTLADRALSELPRRSFKAYRGRDAALRKIAQKNGKKMTLRVVDYSKWSGNAKDVRFIVNIQS